MRNAPARLPLVALVLVALGAPASAQEVGSFAVVQNDVKSLHPGAAEAVPARAGAQIVLDELETSGPASGAKMTFGEGAVISIGQNTKFKITRQAVDEATGASVSAVDLVLGKLRVFVSRIWSGRPGVNVNTPTAVVGVKGSEVAVEVFEDGRCLVTVFTGSAEVASNRSGARRQLGAGQQIQVRSDGELSGEPSSASRPALVALWESTEPRPEAPREMTEERPVLAPEHVGPESSIALNTSSTLSSGTTMSSPPSEVVPGPVDTDASVNTGI